MKKQKLYYGGSFGRRILQTFYSNFFQDIKYVENLIDLGCGMVPYFPLYFQLAGNVTLVDQYAATNMKQILIHDLNNPIPLESNSYNVAVVADVLEHLKNPAAFLSEVNRILKDSGVIVGTVPFLYPIHEMPNDFSRWTNFGLNEILRGAQFTRITIYPLGGLFTIMLDFINKIICKIPGIGILSARIFGLLVFKISSFQCFLRADLATSKYFVYEYGFIAKK